MKITIRQIAPLSLTALRMRGVFLEAFPPEERPPYWFLLLRTKSPLADYCGIFADGRPIGLAYSLRNNRAAYLFYFALRHSERGKGYGSEVMKLLLARYRGLSFFLAHEELDASAENYAERVRRHDFYLRCGLRDMPCGITEAGITYAVMGNGGAVTPELYRELMEPYMGKLAARSVKTYLFVKEASSE